MTAIAIISIVIGLGLQSDTGDDRPGLLSTIRGMGIVWIVMGATQLYMGATEFGAGSFWWLGLIAFTAGFIRGRSGCRQPGAGRKSPSESGGDVKELELVNGVWREK